MKTTELYIEPIIVGFFALIMCALPFSRDLAAFTQGLPQIGLQKDIAIGLMLVGASYLIGILIDRSLDSVLAVMERHARLQFASQELKKKWTIATWQDPYPEDEFRALAFLHGGNNAAAWLQYIRTRVRLLRAMMFLLPGITYVAVIATTHSVNLDGTPVYLMIPGTIDTTGIVSIAGLALGYGLIAGLSIIVSKFDPIHCALKKWKIEQPVIPDNQTALDTLPQLCTLYNLGLLSFSWHLRRLGRWMPPRTNDLRTMLLYLLPRGFATELESRIAEPVNERESSLDKSRGLVFDVLLQPFPIGALLLLLGSVCVALWIRQYFPESRSWVPVAVALLGSAATGLAGWAWWRTTFTFMTYVRLFGKFLKA